MGFSKSASVERLSGVLFGAETLEVVQFWLSQWPGENSLPLWAKFALDGLGGAKSAVAVHEIRPDGCFHCRVWGALLTRGSGIDLTGKNLLDYTSAELRDTRRQRYTAVAKGRIGHGLKEAVHASGLREMAEEIMLPFGDLGDDGGHLLLYHVNWRPSSYDPPKIQISNAFDVATEFELIALCHQGGA